VNIYTYTHTHIKRTIYTYTCTHKYLAGVELSVVINEEVVVTNANIHHAAGSQQIMEILFFCVFRMDVTPVRYMCMCVCVCV
jgi:hypothetical protein